MQHLDQLLREQPHVRDVDYQRLALAAQQDPAAAWPELVRLSIPIVYTAAWRMSEGLRDRDAVAETATAQVFERLRDDDFATVRGFVGFGKWTSLLVRFTQSAPILAERRQARELPPQTDANGQPLPVDDPDGPIPLLDPRFHELLRTEGNRFTVALGKSLHVMHRVDRLILGMRYEQGLTLQELDHLFRLGSPARIASLLARLRQAIQPVRALIEAWQVPPQQQEALMRVAIHHLYSTRSMATVSDEKMLAAVPHR